MHIAKNGTMATNGTSTLPFRQRQHHPIIFTAHIASAMFFFSLSHQIPSNSSRNSETACQT